MKLRLDKLPDRDPVKITFTASPQLKAALDDYAEIYQREYGGRKEPITELIPFILDAFMNSDSSFKRARRDLEEAREPATTSTTKAVSSQPKATPTQPKKGGFTHG